MTSGSTKKIGYLFGSFNPIHIGHLMIAEFMATQTDLDKVELVVSPHNPLKNANELAAETHRKTLAELAVADNPLIEVNAIEFTMPKPSYTIDTLFELKKRRPDDKHVLIIGGDNLVTFEKWKDWESIIEHFGLYVYERPGYSTDEVKTHPNIRIFRPPLVNVSSTYIRDCLRRGTSVRYLVPDSVADYIQEHLVFDKTV